MSPAATNAVLSGIGIVIDNKVNDPASGDLIADLMDQIHDAGIPCLVYDRLPAATARSHFDTASFILLDWELWEKSGGDELERQGIAENIAFLKSLRDVCFVPVFIFSHFGPDGIREHLREAGLLGEQEESAFILLRHKTELKRPTDKSGQPLLDAVTAWIAGNPAIYVLSRWRAAVGQSQTRLFWDLYDKDHNWPGVLWRSYLGEGDDPDHGLADILLRNMRARLLPLCLDPQSVTPTTVAKPDRATTHGILEAAMLVPHNSLPPNQYGSGDVFENGEKSLFVNVRCDCDCLARPGGNPDEVILYLLSAQATTDTKFLNEHWHSTFGLIQPNATCHILFPFRGKSLRIGFGDIWQICVGDLTKERLTRIARITPPYITQIRQRFALHLQREGLPRIPDEALPPQRSAPDLPAVAAVVVPPVAPGAAATAMKPSKEEE